jgi:oxygen-independent coproporphyrinogen-3 oxidase
MAPLPTGSAFGVYIHIPFCSHICPYCDFNTYSGQEALIPRYVTALERDLDSRSSELADRAASSIFLGGGTPSLLTGEQIARILAVCRGKFEVIREAEITIEANPNNVDERYFADLLEAGVNRLSLGVQTTDRRGLRMLGRQHEAADAEAAFLAARRAGFDNISLDLIFGWPGQTLDQWKCDLSAVQHWGGSGPDHLSLYSLIVEPGTPMFDAVERGILSVLDEDSTADLYEVAMEMLADAGYSHYEVANWARPAARMSSHNAIYWRSGDYLGVGAGAHETIAGRRTLSHLLPRTYVEAVEAGRSPAANIEQLEHRVQIGETMMLGLRLLDEGVSNAEFVLRHGVELDEAFGETIAELNGLGMIERLPDRVRLTRRGLMLANDVCARFL